jgi:hypothetical protein
MRAEELKGRLDALGCVEAFEPGHRSEPGRENADFVVRQEERCQQAESGQAGGDFGEPIVLQVEGRDTSSGARHFAAFSMRSSGGR